MINTAMKVIEVSPYDVGAYIYPDGEFQVQRYMEDEGHTGRFIYQYDRPDEVFIVYELIGIDK